MGHAVAPLWGAIGRLGCVVPARRTQALWQGAVGTRWGCGGDAGSPSCRPGVSNERYEFPARPLIASSKSLNELLLLRPAPRARLTAWPALLCCRTGLDTPRPRWRATQAPQPHGCSSIPGVPNRHPWGSERHPALPAQSLTHACSSPVWALPPGGGPVTSKPSTPCPSHGSRGPQHRALPAPNWDGSAGGRARPPLGTSAGSQPKSPSAICHLCQISRQGAVGAGSTAGPGAAA